MQNRGLKGAFLILIGLAFSLGGIWINLASERPHFRLIVTGAVIVILGIWTLVTGKLPHFPSGPMVGLYALGAMSLVGSVFLITRAISTPDDRALTLLIAAGLLIVGIGALVLVRRRY